MIPKIIHYCWFGGGEIPDEYQKYMNTWNVMCPDFEVIRWDESNYDIGKSRYMREAYQSKKWGFVPDYARLDIIYHHGGIYLDTDVEIVHPLDDLLKYSAYAGVEKSSKYLALGLGFGAEKNNAIIKLMLDEYEGLTFIKKNGELNTLPSPEINTRPLIRIGYRYPIKIEALTYAGWGMHILPSEYLCPTSYETGITSITENTYSIHHYAGSWQTDESKAIRALSEVYSKRFGEMLGIKIAKIRYYSEKNGLKGIANLCYQSVLHRLEKTKRKIKNRKRLK